MMSISLYISSVLLPVNVSVMPLRTSIYMESDRIVGSKFLNSVLHRSLYREQYHHTASPQRRCDGHPPAEHNTCFHYYSVIFHISDQSLIVMSSVTVWSDAVLTLR